MSITRTQVRLPIETHQRIIQSAAKNTRSMNGEIVRMLNKVIEAEEEAVKEKTK